MEAALVIVGSLLFLWTGNQQAKRAKPLWFWLGLMGLVAAAHLIAIDFAVMGLGAAFGMMFITVLWFLIWGILVLSWWFHQRQAEAKKLLCMPPIYLLLSLSTNFVHQAQLEAAKEVGDQIVSRIEAFEAANGKLPETLHELASFDATTIPQTGIGLWGNQEYGYMLREDGSYRLRFDATVGVQYFRNADGTWFAED